MKKITMSFRSVTIRKRLMFYSFFIVLIPTAIMLFLFFGRYNTILQDSLLESQVVTSMQAARQINNIADTMTTVGDTIASDRRLHAILGAESLSAAESDYEILRAIIESYEEGMFVSTIRIYVDMDDSFIGQLEGDVFADTSAIRNTYWYGMFSSRDDDVIFAPDYYLSSQEKENLGSLALIQRRDFSFTDRTLRAFIAIYTHDDVLMEPLRDIGLESVEGIISYILNARDTIVTQTDPAGYGTYAMSYNDISHNIPAEGVFIQKNVAGTDVFITYRDIDGTDWRLAWIVPRASIIAQTRNVVLQSGIIYSLMAVIIFILGLFMSRTIVGRINSLRNQMQRIKTERPMPLSLEPGRDEVGELIETYNYMVERINTLLDDTIEAAEELNNVKITALRAQIDPHFLYNTLDMTNWLIKAGENQRASEAIMSLSRFYRLALNRGNLTATVEAELEHVSLYVRLMNMRFDNKIDFVVDMPEDMLEHEIPLIIFQPIVENAIQHGLFEKTSHGGKIIITGWSDDETLFFLISDDGIGMTAEQMSGILIEKNGEGGIGVYNTHRRLQLLYNNKDCGLHYTSEYGKGTDVTFTIPKATGFGPRRLGNPGGKL